LEFLWDFGLRFQNLVIILGVTFVVSTFVPLGPYHFVGEPNVVGVLWNFMLPTGWLALIIGVILIFHKHLGLKNKKLALFLGISSLLIVVIRFQDVDYFLSLYHGISGEFDVDSHAISIFPFAVALVSLLASFLGWFPKIIGLERKN
jgi:hypothetical protein